MQSLWKEDRAQFIRKVLALLLVAFGMVFVIANKGVYYSVHKDKVSIPAEVVANPIVVSFDGDKVFEQEFKGWDGTLEHTLIRFSNQGNQDATGVITVNVLDSDRNLLATSSREMSTIMTTKPCKFKFEEENRKLLSDDNSYILQVVASGVHNSQGTGIFTYEEKGELYGTLTDDGTPIDGRLGATFFYSYYNYGAVVHMYMFFVLAIIFIFFPFAKLDKVIKDKRDKEVDTNKIMTRIFFFASPFLCVMLADRFNGAYFVQMLKHMLNGWTFILNLFIYLVIWFALYTIINRAQYASMILLLFVFAVTIANYYVWAFRGCPILATDIQSAKTAMNVAANFSYKLDLTGVWGVVYIITFTAMLLSLKGYKGAGLKRRGVMLVLSIASLILFNQIFFQSDFVKNRGIKAEVWHPQVRYAKNGTALSFVLSWSYIRVDVPKGYSAQKAYAAMEGYESDDAAGNEATADKLPNVIAIMNESLGDFSYDGDIEYTEDYIPFIHSLSEDTIKGKLYVSIEGANTANSEFEFLTGNTMAFLPYRCIPYNLYINDETASMAQNAKSEGFSGVNAYHPYLASGWNRENVYPLMGFDNFFPDTYYYEHGNDKLVRNYISDESDFQQIIDDYKAAKKADKDKPFYLFNVTMQNHGGYDGKRGLVDTKIKITSDNLNSDEAEQFINLAKMSDDAFKELVNYFKNVDEPTLIVMFGDHQPPVENQFYSDLIGKDVANLPVEKQANWYATPYVIWANYDIEETELDMSANYLSSYVMQLAGMKLTGYNKYLLDLQKEVPIISAVCYMGADGVFHELDEKTEYSDKIEEYQVIQYNNLFDIDNRNNDFFFLK
jgi:phosphoglycerol transferase MdoB-like AlkP superfamily enzyme